MEDRIKTSVPEEEKDDHTPSAAILIPIVRDNGKGGKQFVVSSFSVLSYPAAGVRITPQSAVENVSKIAQILEYQRFEPGIFFGRTCQTQEPVLSDRLLCLIQFPISFFA